MGVAKELKELYLFLNESKTRDAITDYCSLQGICWKFTPEQARHFGGLWEAAVKSFKGHFRKIVGEVKLTFEELSTVACQIQACMNSRPLSQLPERAQGRRHRYGWSGFNRTTFEVQPRSQNQIELKLATVVENLHLTKRNTR